MTEPPKEYMDQHTNAVSGTDIYLTLISTMLSCMIVRTGLMAVMVTHEFMVDPNYIWALMAVTGAVAGENCIKSRSTKYKARVSNAITEALKTVFVGPFTALAHIGYCVTTGFSITRNLFD